MHLHSSKCANQTCWHDWKWLLFLFNWTSSRSADCPRFAACVSASRSWCNSSWCMCCKGLHCKHKVHIPPDLACGAHTLTQRVQNTPRCHDRVTSTYCKTDKQNDYQSTLTHEHSNKVLQKQIHTYIVLYCTYMASFKLSTQVCWLQMWYCETPSPHTAVLW